MNPLDKHLSTTTLRDDLGQPIVRDTRKRPMPRKEYNRRAALILEDRKARGLIPVYDEPAPF